MKMVIVGAGAVGGYFGARMVEAGIPTVFYVREKRYLDLKKNGLAVRSAHGDVHIQPELAKNPEEVEHPDLVILAVKGYHLERIFLVIDQWVAGGAKVLPLLNGIEAMDKLAERYGRNAVMGGLCYVESTLDGEGRIAQTSQMQEIMFGSISTATVDFAKQLYEVLQPCNFKVTLSDNIRTDMWEKYLFLTVLSGMTAATRQPIGISLQDEVTHGYLQNMLDELILLTKAEGIEFSYDIKEKITQRFKAMNKKMTSSLARDLEKGLPLELNNLHGYAIRLGEKHKIPVPCTRAVFALLHPYMNGRPNI